EQVHQLYRLRAPPHAAMVAQEPGRPGHNSHEMNSTLTDPFQALRERMAQLADLRTVAQLLDWDQQTMMPPRGAEARAETVATVQRISHEMFVSDETGRL